MREISHRFERMVFDRLVIGIYYLPSIIIKILIESPLFWNSQQKCTLGNSDQFLKLWNVMLRELLNLRKSFCRKLCHRDLNQVNYWNSRKTWENIFVEMPRRKGDFKRNHKKNTSYLAYLSSGMWAVIHPDFSIYRKVRMNDSSHARRYIYIYPGSRSRSKTAQDLSGLSGFPARFERFERFGRFFLEKPLKPLKSCLKNRSKTAQKPLISCGDFWTVFQARFERFLSGFWAVFPGWGPRLPPPPPTNVPPPQKPLKPLKSCFKLGEKSRLGIYIYIFFFIIISVNRHLELFDVMNYLFSALKARCVRWSSQHLQTCSQCMSKASSLSIICSETIDFETPLFLSDLTILNKRLLKLVEVTRVTYGF